MKAKRRLIGATALAAAGLLVAACSSSSSTAAAGNGTAAASAAATSSSSGQVTIGVDLTYNNTAFWARSEEHTSELQSQ